MSHDIRQPSTRTLAAGFTLIELMIALAVVAILAAVALPSYLDSVRKGRRSEAISAIAAVQQAQERARSNFTSYCDDDHLTSAATTTQCGLNVPRNTPNGYYALALSDISSTGYTVTATAAGSQADDTRCAKMAAKVSDGNLSYGSGSSSIDWTDANRCWAK
jgi:type IV pilus assembly protein PilE